jgi:hypothetical protein
MGRGVPKRFTRAELARRRARMVEINRKREEAKLQIAQAKARLYEIENESHRI